MKKRPWLVVHVLDDLFVPLMLVAVALVHCATVHEDKTGTQIVLCKAASDAVRKLLPDGSTAVTLPGRISLLPPNPDAALLCHEGIHREQELRVGSDKWPGAYLFEHLAHGYQGNKYEVEARERCAELGPS